MFTDRTDSRKLKGSWPINKMNNNKFGFVSSISIPNIQTSINKCSYASSLANETAP